MVQVRSLLIRNRLRRVALPLTLALAFGSATSAFATDEEESEDPSPFRREERPSGSEKSQPGIFSGLAKGLFETRTTGVSADYLVMESAQLDTLIGTGSGRMAGVAFSATRGNSIFELIGRVRFQYAAGKAVIEDGAASRTLPFLLVGGEALLGISVHLLPGEFRGVQPYLGTAYKIGLNQLSLSGVPESSTELSGASSGSFLGSEFFVGVKAGRHYSLEFQLRQSVGSIAGLTDVGIGGAAVSFGYRW